MAALRESALLPTVKCSSCGLQVEISLMGDHMCSGPTAELSPPPEHDGKFHDGPFHRPPEKHGRVPAPVDTGAANRAFLNQGQLSPVSQPVSRSASPMTPGARSSSGQAGDYCTSGGDRVEGPSRTTPPFLRRPGEFAGQGPQGGAQRSSSTSKPIGKALTDKMNGMTPGPFDTSRRSPAAGENRFPPRKDSLTKWEGLGHLNEPAKEKNCYGSSYSNAPPGSIGNVFTPKQPTRNGYEGFGPPPTPRSAGLSMESMGRPEASPMSAESFARPSRQIGQAMLLPPMSVPSGRRPSLSPVTSRRPPPRTSLIPQDMATGSVDLAAEFGSSNPYHAPSESSSSGCSTFSAQSDASSQSSLSNSSLGEDGDSTSVKRDRLHSFADNLRPTDSHADSNAPTRSPSFPPSSYASSPGIMRPGSAMRNGPGLEGYRPYVPTPSPRQDARSTGHASSERSITPPQRKVTPETGIMASSRGECKACRQAITGKSVSSADGRLTGKYHKACFVCTTCSEPFSSAEFYVLDDRPYCEQHYHRLNGSLCGGCGRGIEGQYVEDESRVKHHVDCFCCIDCGTSLSSGYFEVDGKAYCERDALKRTQTTPQPFLHNPGSSVSYGQHPYSPGPRSHGIPPGPPRTPGRAPPGFGSPGMGHPGTHRGPPGGYSPGYLGSGMNQSPKPTMNKRMTRFGVM